MVLVFTTQTTLFPADGRGESSFGTFKCAECETEIPTPVISSHKVKEEKNKKTESPQHPGWTQSEHASWYEHFRSRDITCALSYRDVEPFHFYLQYLVQCSAAKRNSRATTGSTGPTLCWKKRNKKEHWGELWSQWPVFKFSADLLMAAHYMGNYAQGYRGEERHKEHSRRRDRDHLSCSPIKSPCRV